MAAQGSITGAERTSAPRTSGSPTAPEIRLLASHDVPAAATVLVRAFAEEPAKHALFRAGASGREPFSDEATRTRFAAAVAMGRLRALERYAAAHVAVIDGSVVGVAMWNPPGVKSGMPPGGTILRALTQPGTRVVSLLSSVSASLWQERRTLWRLLAGRTAAARQAGRGASWYLAVLGTDPDYRGRGVARGLLERTLDRCDVEGLPAWLETTEEATAGLYERFGFETVAAIEGGTLLPGLWVMRREPQRRGDA